MADESARVLMGVRGMDTDDARDHVASTLLAVVGVQSVEHADEARITVCYDPTEVTAMELIRALRRIGFLAGME